LLDYTPLSGLKPGASLDEYFDLVKASPDDFVGAEVMEGKFTPADEWMAANKANVSKKKDRSGKEFYVIGGEVGTIYGVDFTGLAIRLGKDFLGTFLFSRFFYEGAAHGGIAYADRNARVTLVRCDILGPGDGTGAGAGFNQPSGGSGYNHSIECRYTGIAGDPAKFTRRSRVLFNVFDPPTSAGCLPVVYKKSEYAVGAIVCDPKDKNTPFEVAHAWRNTIPGNTKAPDFKRREKGKVINGWIYFNPHADSTTFLNPGPDFRAFGNTFNLDLKRAFWPELVAEGAHTAGMNSHTWFEEKHQTHNKGAQICGNLMMCPPVKIGNPIAPFVGANIAHNRIERRRTKPPTYLPKSDSLFNGNVDANTGKSVGKQNGSFPEVTGDTLKALAAEHVVKDVPDLHLPEIVEPPKEVEVVETPKDPEPVEVDATFEEPTPEPVKKPEPVAFKEPQEDSPAKKPLPPKKKSKLPIILFGVLIIGAIIFMIAG